MENKNILAKKVLDLYEDENQNLDNALDEIINRNYTILPTNICVGSVYKVDYEGDLKQEGYEKAYLYLPKGTGIKLHKHIKDIERYEVLMGRLSVNGREVDVNDCLIGESHNIDICSEDTIIRTLKISEELIDKYDCEKIEKDIKVIQLKNKEIL